MSSRSHDLPQTWLSARREKSSSQRSMRAHACRWWRTVQWAANRESLRRTLYRFRTQDPQRIGTRRARGLAHFSPHPATRSGWGVPYVVTGSTSGKKIGKHAPVNHCSGLIIPQAPQHQPQKPLRTHRASDNQDFLCDSMRGHKSSDPRGPSTFNL
jgi:hypothetical protein